MRRIYLAAAISLVLLCVAAGPASAGPLASQSVPPNSFVSGAFSGSGVIIFTPDCDGVHTDQQYVYGVGEPPPFSGTVALQGCVHLNSSPFTVDGSFVITARNGSTLSGTLVGLATAPPGGFTNTYTVTGGTGQFSHVSGTIDVSASVPSIDQITGTYVPHLTFAP
jgi:hypothetical protein